MKADLLTKQMNALIAFRITVENPNGICCLASDVAASSASLSASAPSMVGAASSKYLWRIQRWETRFDWFLSIYIYMHNFHEEFSRTFNWTLNPLPGGNQKKGSQITPGRIRLLRYKYSNVWKSTKLLRLLDQPWEASSMFLGRHSRTSVERIWRKLNSS